MGAEIKERLRISISKESLASFDQTKGTFFLVSLLRG